MEGERVEKKTVQTNYLLKQFIFPSSQSVTEARVRVGHGKKKTCASGLHTCVPCNWSILPLCIYMHI